MLQHLSLTTGSVLVASSGADRAVPFALSDIGWVLAAMAVTLALALALKAVTRRRAASQHAQPLSRRSTDP